MIVSSIVHGLCGPHESKRTLQPRDVGLGTAVLERIAEASFYCLSWILWLESFSVYAGLVELAFYLPS